MSKKILLQKESRENIKNKTAYINNTNNNNISNSACITTGKVKANIMNKRNIFSVVCCKNDDFHIVISEKNSSKSIRSDENSSDKKILLENDNVNEITLNLNEKEIIRLADSLPNENINEHLLNNNFIKFDLSNVKLNKMHEELDEEEMLMYYGTKHCSDELKNEHAS